MSRLIVMLLMIGYVGVAQAATFCLGGAGMSPQCIYEDVTSCRHAASPPNTACIVNPEAPLSYSGGSRYCTLDASRVAVCLYADRGACNRVADNGAGICIDREAMTDDINPFRFDNRVQN